MSIVMQINPFDYFADKDGDPLDGGYIWIGQPNKDPRQYPVIAYYDAALTIPAGMPLRTLNGYVVHNGSPTILYISGNYSVMLLDKNGAQIFYVPDFLLIGAGQAVTASDMANTTDPTKGAGLIGHPTGKTLNSAVINITNVAELRLLQTPTVIAGARYCVRTLGYYAAGDGGGGLFFYDPADVVSPDNNGTTIVGASGARWKWCNPIEANVLSFGAVPGAIDSSVPFQNCISAIGTAFIPFNIAGYTVANLTLTTNQKLVGDSKVKLFTTAGALYGVRVTSFGIGTYAFIEGILWDLVASPTTTTAVLMGTASNVVFGFRMSNTDFMNCGAAYGEEIHATNYTVDCYISDCVCYFSRGQQFYSRRSRGFWTLKDFKVDHTYNTTQVSWGGIRFDDFIGVEFDKVDVVGPVIPVSTYQATAIGVQFTGAAGSASIWLRRLLIDNTRGPGLTISNCHNVFADDLCVFQNLGASIDLVNVQKSQFTGTKIVGGVGLPGAAASANGVSATGCVSVLFNGLQVEFCTGSGVVRNNCIDVSVKGGYSSQNTLYGYNEAGTATRNLTEGVRALTNGVASLNQLGAQSATVNWWPNSGAFIAQTLGVATI